MIFKDKAHAPIHLLEQDISNAHRAEEKPCVLELIEAAATDHPTTCRIMDHAEQLVLGARKSRQKKGGLDAFLTQYDLSSEEGVTLMCLAEALLRIPDKKTADKLIQDKICKANWRSHLKQSDSLFVNAATWGLLLTGKIIHPKHYTDHSLSGVFKKLLSRSSEGSIRAAVKQAMKILGRQFVLGETIQEALKRATEQEAKGYRYSYDMLGEAAKTDKDAQYYQKAYLDAIDAIGKTTGSKGIYEGAGISVKLSALLARYEATQIQRVMTELYERIKALAIHAKSYNIGLTIDAEEADRLEISMQVIEKLALDPELSGWDGLGLALQAYQKRAYHVIDWLVDLAKRSNRRLMVRLVKGAYWDSEIKNSQVNGLPGYPVFTRKVYTDVSYLACAKKLLAHSREIYPQFATHNAHTLAAVMAFSGDNRDFEFQCLHGMGDALYDQVVQASSQASHIPCRIYAPVGSHEHLLAYLVRRLLENGANSSFVNRLIDAKVAPRELVQDPVSQARELGGEPHPKIPLPRHIYDGGRLNSLGIDLNNRANTYKLDVEMESAIGQWEAYPLIAGRRKPKRETKPVTNPSNTNTAVGTLIQTNEEEIAIAMDRAHQAFERWEKTPAIERANCLRRMGDLLEKHMPLMMSMAVKEAGKSIPNAIAEVREAVDFCRYYAEQAEQLFASPIVLNGPTGEYNALSHHGRGVVVCISPWNFPLAIFLGEVTAAIAAGNTVIAKPAEQTSLIAHKAVELLYEAGIPKDVVQCLPGRGSIIGPKLTSDARVNTVIFTGSTETAKSIQKSLADKPGPIAGLIAETGGQNTLIVDSSALLEQVTTDVMASAFDSAGQRCSALRVLFVQEDIADNLINMIKGAMQELTIGNPQYLSTDIGPVIDEGAKKTLMEHIASMKQQAKLIYQVNAGPDCHDGTFVPPTAFELKDISLLEQEVFGPVLHIIRFKADDLDGVIRQINSTGYGLTAGIHSRVSDTVEYIRQRLRVGNLYVNRNQIGAVVGVQPFGGEGLSGTGPKAGGPHYLTRLANERSISIDTTASGGNASLMSLEE